MSTASPAWGSADPKRTSAHAQPDFHDFPLFFAQIMWNCTAAGLSLTFLGVSVQFSTKRYNFRQTCEIFTAMKKKTKPWSNRSQIGPKSVPNRSQVGPRKRRPRTTKNRQKSQKKKGKITKNTKHHQKHPAAPQEAAGGQTVIWDPRSISRNVQEL